MVARRGPFRLVRAADLLVLEVEAANLQVSDDGQRLERIDPGAPATLVIRLPGQHVAERAYFDFENSQETADQPPVGALAAGGSRLAFTLRDGVDSLPFSVDGLLDWATLAPRLAANALPPGTVDGPAPQAPDQDVTAIEFPYRLWLSPDATGRWTHRSAPFTSAAGRTEVWHTRLNPGPVRAIARRQVPDTMRTSLSDNDLAEIVMLSSDFSIRPKNWAELGMPFQLWVLRLQAAGLLGYRYTPVPLDADELMLTPLGASTHLRGRWDYPDIARDPQPTLEELRMFGMPTPSLQQYEHITGLGRDQYARVVRRGYCHPGLRASIIKVTERRFEPRQLGTVQTPNGPVARFGAIGYLRQYYKIVLQEPDLDYEPLNGGYAKGGREMPLRHLRMTTLETPKIDLPVSPAEVESQARLVWLLTHRGQQLDHATELEFARQAQAALEDKLKTPFWIQVSGKDFEFGYVGTDWEGRPVSGTMPMLFVPQESVSNSAAVVGEFAKGPSSRRTRPLGNQVIALADRNGSDCTPGSTSVPAESITFTLQDATTRAGALPRRYRPRWVLAVAGSTAHLAAVARLTGHDTPVDLTFHPDYLDHGLGSAANVSGSFAKLPATPVAFGGARGGGLAHPDLSVGVLSARQGAMAANLAAPAGAVPNLAAVFGSAKILGLISLADLIGPVGPLGPEHFASDRLTDAELADLLARPGARLDLPVLRTRRFELDGKPAMEARFVWKPPLNLALPPDKLLSFDPSSEFVLDLRTVECEGRTATTTVGELREFGLRFAGVVSLRLRLLRFLAQPDRKPDLHADGVELHFDGPLRFVNTLRELLPANGFSDPPAVSVTPDGIQAGFSLAVPTIGVGIFSLQNLALSAALSVPFVGKPAGLRFAISERHHPFLVTVTLFGGGGFFALGVSAAGVDEIEAAIEFGGSVALNLGVASGGVYVMAGVYFGLTGSATTLTGYLRCGGYLSVLGLITVSIEFYLAFTYRALAGGGSEVWGQADVTVSVKVACISMSVRLSLERRFAGSAGDPTLDQVLDQDDFTAYCRAFALEGA